MNDTVIAGQGRPSLSTCIARKMSNEGGGGKRTISQCPRPATSHPGNCCQHQKGMKSSGAAARRRNNLQQFSRLASRNVSALPRQQDRVRP